MNLIASIRKIFSISNYDLKNNIKNWFYLIGLQAILGLVLSLFVFLPGSFSISYPHPFFLFDSYQLVLDDEYFSLAYNFRNFFIYSKFLLCIILELCRKVLFPIMILQNALDLAFDSSMRGFTIKGPLFSYFFIVLSFALFGQFVSVWYSIFMNLEGYELIGFSAVIASWIMYVYLYQKLRFVGLHLFEYKQGVIKSIQASWKMTQGKILFLSIVSCIQIILFFIFYYGYAYLDEFLMNLVVYRFGIYVDSIFITIATILISTAMMTVWLCMTVWYYLIEAHIYRELICPATQQTGCSSCECGS